ncbi:MAG: hypothetical protein ACM3YO_00890 [Bacteroidota bacterium]
MRFGRIALGAFLALSAVGCTSPVTQTPEKNVQWAQWNMPNVPLSQQEVNACGQMVQTPVSQQVLQQNLPQQIPYTQAGTLLTQLDSSKIAMGQNMPGQDLNVQQNVGYSTMQFRSFAYRGWWPRFFSYPYRYTSLSYYPFGNYYYPYYYYNNYYYPYYYNYANTYYYPYLYNTGLYYRPYFYSAPNFWWRYRGLRW